MYVGKYECVTRFVFNKQHHYKRPVKTRTKWYQFWTTEQFLFHIKKDELKQTHLCVAGKEQGVQVITNAARTGYTLHLVAFWTP